MYRWQYAARCLLASREQRLICTEVSGHSWRALWKVLAMRQRYLLLHKMGRVADIFRALDKDHSNTIDKNEWRVALVSLGFTKEDANEMWTILDADGSGEIVYHELLSVLQPPRAAAKPSVEAMDPNACVAFRYNQQDAQKRKKQGPAKTSRPRKSLRA